MKHIIPMYFGLPFNSGTSCSSLFSTLSTRNSSSSFLSSAGFSGSAGFSDSAGFSGSAGFSNSAGFSGSTGFSDSAGFSPSAGFSGSPSAGCLSGTSSALSASSLAGDNLQLGTRSGICSSLSARSVVFEGRGCGRGGKVINRRIELIQASTIFFITLSWNGFSKSAQSDLAYTYNTEWISSQYCRDTVSGAYTMFPVEALLSKSLFIVAQISAIIVHFQHKIHCSGIHGAYLDERERERERESEGEGEVDEV